VALLGLKGTMTDQQLYFAIGVPVFAVFMGMLTNVVAVMWQSKGLERTFSFHCQV
jgi:hypothetical protein